MVRKCYNHIRQLGSCVHVLVSFILCNNLPNFIPHIQVCFRIQYSEACLLLANKLESSFDDELRSRLINESLRYSDKSEEVLKDDGGNVICALSYAHHSALVSQLEDWSNFASGQIINRNLHTLVLELIKYTLRTTAFLI